LIKETLSQKNNPSVTSDCWHVIHARWSGEMKGTPLFDREIVSEHADRDLATAAARKMVAALAKTMTKRAPERRDQVLVRRPGYKSLKSAVRFHRRPK
jgi:hypothetical protein